MKKVFDKINNKNYYLFVSNYLENNRLFIKISDKEGFDSFNTITHNLPNEKISNKCEIFLSNNLSNNIIDKLIQKGIITEPIKTVNCNMSKYKCAKVNFDILKEYDEHGVEEFLKLEVKEEINSEKTKDKLFDKFNEKEIMEILKNDERLVHIFVDGEDYIGRYDDIPDIIVDFNNKLGLVNLKVYDYDGFSFNPILTTSGEFLDKCDMNVRNDHIDRLIELQMGDSLVKPYKLIDEKLLEKIELFINQDEVLER